MGGRASVAVFTSLELLYHRCDVREIIKLYLHTVWENKYSRTFEMIFKARSFPILTPYELETI